MKKEIEQMKAAYEEYERCLNIVNELLEDVCEFEAAVLFLSGDAHCVLNILSRESLVSPIKCLAGKTPENKLTEEQHRKTAV